MGQNGFEQNDKIDSEPSDTNLDERYFSRNKMFSKIWSRTRSIRRWLSRPRNFVFFFSQLRESVRIPRSLPVFAPLLLVAFSIFTSIPIFDKPRRCEDLRRSFRAHDFIARYFCRTSALGSQKRHAPACQRDLRSRRRCLMEISRNECQVQERCKEEFEDTHSGGDGENEKDVENSRGCRLASGGKL